jgi:hypothetical protein
MLGQLSWGHIISKVGILVLVLSLRNGTNRTGPLLTRLKIYQVGWGEGRGCVLENSPNRPDMFDVFLL